MAVRQKKIVFVSQGTVAVQWPQLLLPTLKAFSDRDDVVVIGVLGSRGASLPSDVELPSNAKVVDYLPYDIILEKADVFVSNGGYGAFCHAVMNGVPAVFAGETEEKPEVAMRGSWAGFALNLRTQTPTSNQIRYAVDKVLKDPKYRSRALELKKRMMVWIRWRQLQVTLLDSPYRP